MNERIGVIDLGSNTFHLLIVDVVSDKMEEVYRQRSYTFLSEGGLDVILPKQMELAKLTIDEFAEKISFFHVKKLRIIGTAALRKASNSLLLVQYIEHKLSVNVEIIEGKLEASYIFKGISSFRQLHKGKFLIMDIGGGSTEFIIVDDGKNIWSQSYTLGVGHLYSLKKLSDPTTTQEIDELIKYVYTSANDLTQLLQNAHFDGIVGASGSFEVLLSMIGQPYEGNNLIDVTIDSFHSIYQRLIFSTMDDRLAMEAIPKERAKLIVTAFVLKYAVLNLASFKKIIFSPYSLKEGVLSEMIHDIK